ncbi:acyl-ACP--UDP-N-acetylglucosamine O-acyltransferase [Rariglobus hedericola]|uniref:Acyl-ACP--UDP-N-acetylglucosamine O-acyltransferase n=1 Tax=Rariglobus hedericola TaxID=2597822 RepID=A0A556QEJ1_9BACT|nr:acyl-ACP--UDP-N-acetylglucosamine O-acyltransferase [Rariglobus hedericola]TSJ75026.1 acyl-ACP--UDP-N-acetylglucosamine O-acyltransferase [Rariglobus hedericola]
MSARIHPTAVIEDGAELGADVEIGAFAFVGAGVRLGARTRLHHHASVEGNTHLGEACEIFPYANIGAKTQDLKYKGGNPGVRIGARNVFREYVTVHAATNDGDMTVLGDDNTILAYGHIAHDCVLGSHIVTSNSVMLAGHVIIEDHVVIGGGGGVHQFCRVGAHAMLSAMAKLVQDLPPFFIADGMPALVRAYNKVGLERRGYTQEQLDRVRHIYRVLYRDGLNRSQALEKMAAHPEAQTEEFQRVLAFAAKSERGIVPGA